MSSMQDNIARLGNHDSEYEAGILSIVISLCKGKEARGMSLAEAKKETANYLDKISRALRE